MTDREGAKKLKDDYGVVCINDCVQEIETDDGITEEELIVIIG